MSMILNLLVQLFTTTKSDYLAMFFPLPPRISFRITRKSSLGMLVNDTSKLSYLHVKVLDGCCLILKDSIILTHVLRKHFFQRLLFVLGRA